VFALLCNHSVDILTLLSIL